MNEKIAKILEEKRKLKINENWLNACISFLHKHSNLSAEMMAEKVFDQIANSDFKLSSKGFLPSSIKDLKKISGSHLFQVEDSINIGENYESRGSESRGRCMKVNLSDGMNDIWAFEYQRIPQFSVQIPPGTKIEITDATVRRGMILLTPLNTKVIGGTVKEMIEAWQKRKENASNKNDQTNATVNLNDNVNNDNRNVNNIGNNNAFKPNHKNIPNNNSSTSVSLNGNNNLNTTSKIINNGINNKTDNNTKNTTKSVSNSDSNISKTSSNNQFEKIDKMEEDPPSFAEKTPSEPISLVSDGEEDIQPYHDSYDDIYLDCDDNYDISNDGLKDESSFIDMDDPQLAPYTYLSQAIEDLERKSTNSNSSKLYDPTNPSKFVKVKAAVTNLVRPFQFQKGKFSLDVEIDDGHSSKMLVTLSDPVIQRILGMTCDEFKKNLTNPTTKAHNMNKLKDMEKEMARMEGIFSMEFTLGSKPVVNDISNPTLDEIEKFCNFLEAEETKKKREGSVKEERESKKMKVEEDDFEWETIS
eukprot:TRINITY_DN4053_c0_g1_i4.p1 TRINITY_DN4053_c0_g1~~TRINITY_DN4053_c0_g1_i4.p1  ORF type:complete len:529 (-),score=195.76 TRINITY_DN4053_c0_g1_i4:202-1788(-)